MLKLSVKTKLSPIEALDHAKNHFEKNGLTLVEMIAHFHWKGGFTEVRVSGGKLVGRTEHDSRYVLDSITRHVEENLGFQAISHSLHFHTSLGYVDVHVSNEKPAEVTMETTEYESQVKELAYGLPKA